MVESSLNRSLTSLRIRKALSNPVFALRNLKFNWVRKTSTANHVFVVGPPRSGTTLMVSMLKAHSNLAGIDGETCFFFRRNFTDIKYPEIDDQTMKKLIASATDMVDLFDMIASEVVTAQNASRFVEKTPEHALRLNFLLKRFPKAKIVFMIRDVRDGYLSALRNPKVKVNTVSLYGEIWKLSVRAYLKATQKERVKLIRYEELCSNPEIVMTEVMSFLDESLQITQLASNSYSKTKMRSVIGHQRLNEKISNQTVGQWREKMSNQDVEIFNTIAGEELQKMGYSLV
ncbi:sulfotransferase [Plectonema cf. radiosum LEGE 06105]|uniref:Sulfotransferase n=1 Tax=Plectonema cf. radiosum LEGE 06105 TaxID=945769 RepID=A0A8J7F207_9CYAN|nr:sulfotransferase [Plectonema radiosum]MBE9213407.1 sulfotransferase [Plectonema cf. radiosum LEGE 06105]